jgi:hypothetical protein
LLVDLKRGSEKPSREVFAQSVSTYRVTRKRVVTILLAMSAAVSIGVAVIAARSYVVHDSLLYGWRSPEHRTVTAIRISSAHGRLLFGRNQVDDNSGTAEEWEKKYPASPGGAGIRYWTGPASQIGNDTVHLYQRLGFDSGTSEFGTHGRRHTVVRFVIFPWWLVIVMFCAAPVWAAARWLVRFPSELRRRRGLCVKCGYDLRATESGKCPECGTPTGAPPRTA